MLIHVVKAGETLLYIANLYKASVESIIEVNELPNPNRLIIGQALLIPVTGYIYTVKPGDSLWTIAQRYKITVESILEYNQIQNPDRISPGMELYLPAIVHTVQSGDTLWNIAQKYGVTVQSLLQTNNLQDTVILYPGDEIIVPKALKPNVYVNGYIYFLGQQAFPIVQDTGEHLTYVSPFAYLIREDGSLESIEDNPAIRASYSVDAIPMMAITNFTSTERGENLAGVVLNSNLIIQRLLSNIIDIMRQKGYQGLNVDFENVLPRDREAYNNFLRVAVNTLHPLGYFVSTAVAPKTGREQVGLLYEAHDYEAHGEIVDFVILMTYEWGFRKGPPRAISPVNEIKRVLDYAVTVIPRDKIYFGFQIYARDWLLPFEPGDEAETFSPQQAIIRALRYGTVIQYDKTAESPYYTYFDDLGRRHIVWFEDARSAQAKFNAVKEYNLQGISYWALGYPYPQNWALLEDTFDVQKLL